MMAGLAALAYKNRPYHRGMMIGGVVELLVKTDAEAAQRAVNAAIKKAPGDPELENKRILVLLRRGKHEEALAALNGLSSAEPAHVVLKAWALMGLGRADEALALTEALSPDQRERPGVAIVRAECAATRGDTQGVVDNIPHASGWPVLAGRVRTLFPYLAVKEQWKTIARCEMPVPHTVPAQAGIDVLAHLKGGDLNGAWDILKDAIRRWPQEPGCR